MRNVLLTIEYDGTALFGWQRQPNRPTAQSQIELCLARILGRAVPIAGVSRTDAGVHAFAQKASFVLDSPIPLCNLQIALNNMLAKDKQSGGAIRIKKIEQVPQDFHARFSCVGKKYIYKIDNSEYPNLFERNYYYQVKKPLNIADMKKAAMYIAGTHDFASFQTAGGTPRETTVRTVYSLDILEKEFNNLIAFDEFCGFGEKSKKLEVRISGDGFLYNMVRIIVGTLVDVGHGKIEPQAVRKIIEEKNRQNAGHTAPACGLYLAQVYYDDKFLTV